MIRKVFISLLCILAVPTCMLAQYRTGSYRDLYDSETVSSLKNHVAYLASSDLDGRAPGSEGERLAARYMTEVLGSYGAEVISGEDGDIFGLLKEDKDTLTSRNVLAVIPGADPSLREHYIVVGARMDNLGGYDMTVDGEVVHRFFAGANGNASGMAILLELGRMLSSGRALLGRSVLLAGFGASGVTCAGSWYLLNRQWPLATSPVDAMVCLDMLGSGTFGAYSSSNIDMDGIARVVSSRLQPIRPEIISQEPFASDNRSFYESGIPSMLFTTGRFSEYNSVRDVPSVLDYETMERELGYIYNYIVELSGAQQPRFRITESSSASEGRSHVISFYECDRRPTFLGSANPETFLSKWVYKYLRYPEEAVRNGIQGNVTVDFIIDENGKVGSVKVIRGADELLDAEAVRVISASPAWKPARNGGKKVPVELSLTIEFRLERRGSFGINGVRIN